MMILAAYNLVNVVWVSGLGSDALAAVGFVSPIFMVVVDLSNGLGAGVSSSLSRKIGARDKSGADNTSMHAMSLMIIVSAMLTLVLLYFLEPMLVVMCAGVALDLSVKYGNIVFAGSILIAFTNTA
jgi:Na+-driven multidrug efflux pump